MLVNEIRDLLDLAKRLVSMDIERFLADYRNRYTLRHLIIEIVEACTNLGLVILRERLGIKEVYGYRDVFKKLSENGVISNSVRVGMENLIGLRNIIIHRYWEVDDQKIYMDARSNGLALIEKYVVEVEEYVSRSREN